jgi:hypothetical protein
MDLFQEHSASFIAAQLCSWRVAVSIRGSGGSFVRPAAETETNSAGLSSDTLKNF